jgi:hypothetical protein
VEFEKRKLEQEDDGRLGSGGLVDKSSEAYKRQKRE